MRKQLNDLFIKLMTIFLTFFIRSNKLHNTVLELLLFIVVYKNNIRFISTTFILF